MMGLNYQRIYGRRQKSLNLTRNPIGVANEDDLNLYAYVGNDPLDRTDPTGLKCETTTSGPSCTFDEFRDKNGKVISSTPSR